MASRGNQSQFCCESVVVGHVRQHDDLVDCLSDVKHCPGDQISRWSRRECAARRTVLT